MFRKRLGLVAAFAGLGGTAATIPAMLPSLEARLDASVLPAVPLLFGGLLVGVLLSAPLLVRVRVRTVVIAGSALQAGALFWLAAATSLPEILVIAACAGAGFGLTEAAGSVAAKRWERGSATRSLAMLTAAVAVVAALSPIAVAFLPGGVWLVPVLVAVIHLLACGAIARVEESITVPGEAAETDGPRWTPAARRVLVVAGVALALYVGVETVFSGWSALIPAAVLDIDPQSAALGTSGFWLCMAAGRVIAAAVLRMGVQPVVLLLACMAVAAAALLLTSLLAPSAVMLVGLGVAVLAMAPVYSLVLGEALDRLSPQAAARATGPLVACGALGGTMVPMVLVAAGLEPDNVATFLVAAGICIIIGAGALATLAAPTASPRHSSTHQGVSP
ncbi:MAG: MFS transporter [Homoserinimonas sp.]